MFPIISVIDWIEYSQTHPPFFSIISFHIYTLFEITIGKPTFNASTTAIPKFSFIDGKIKQNKLSPGMHIPIYDYQYFNNNMPNYCFLLAWNLKEEILNKEIDNFSKKGKWITHIPKIKILDDR